MNVRPSLRGRIKVYILDHRGGKDVCHKRQDGGIGRGPAGRVNPVEAGERSIGGSIENGGRAGTVVEQLRGEDGEGVAGNVGVLGDEGGGGGVF